MLKELQNFVNLCLQDSGVCRKLYSESAELKGCNKNLNKKVIIKIAHENTFP